MGTIWLALVILSACQASSPTTPIPTPSPTLPLTLEPTPTPLPWFPELEGQTFLNYRGGRCLYRQPVPILFPAASGGLREVAGERGMWVGASVAPSPLRGLNEYNTATAREYNIIVPENSLKFEIVHPRPDVYNFCQMDTIVAFAEVNGMRLRGHPLVWEQQLPVWVRELSLEREDWIALLKDHVTHLVRRYAGKVEVWDVINEPLTEEGTLKETLWFQNIGPDAIEMALRWAHEADPNAQLFINEFATENLNPKSDALYALAQDLLARGVPLHGIGFQMHLIEPIPPDPEQIAENFRRFGDLGLEVQITELDVRLKEPVTPEELTHQAEIYRMVFEACLSAANCDTVVMWGVNDHSSWIPYFYDSWGSPLILDDDYEHKPAYRAILETLLP